MKTNPDEGAFIAPFYTAGVIIPRGLTKREYFAGLVMQGLLAANVEATKDDKLNPLVLIAKASVAQADALIAELNKGE